MSEFIIRKTEKRLVTIGKLINNLPQIQENPPEKSRENTTKSIDKVRKSLYNVPITVQKTEQTIPLYLYLQFKYNGNPNQKQ